MNYENRIVLFLDILGFKEILSKTERKIDDEIVDNPDKIQELYTTLEGIYRHASWRTRAPNTSMVVTQFSDSIVISFVAEGESLIMLFDDILKLLADLVLKGILCRGGNFIWKINSYQRRDFWSGFG